MELRRALLLFAIVLGIAAIATSLSGPDNREEKTERSRAEPATPSAGPQPEGTEPAAISFTTQGTPVTERLGSGRAAAVIVEVGRPGQVELAGLGLSDTADPLTPARFDVFERRPGSYDVRFIPAQSGEVQTIGELRIVR